MVVDLFGSLYCSDSGTNSGKIPSTITGLQIAVDSLDVVILNCMCCLCQDAFSLLAYSDPASSPFSYQLNPVQREPVCTALNSAILGQSLSCPCLLLMMSFSLCSKSSRLNDRDCQGVSMPLVKYLKACKFTLQNFYT